MHSTATPPDAQILQGEPLRYLRITPTNEVLRLVDGDGGPIVRVRATWSAGIATVRSCPCCGREKRIRMRQRRVVYLLSRCDAGFALRFFLVDARLNRRAAGRRPVGGGWGA